MSGQCRKLPPALKHGIYSATDILPGESRAEFEKWHKGIIADLQPTGPLEDQVVHDVARLTWRKRNMTTLRLAERAQQRNAAIRAERIPTADADSESLKNLGKPEPDTLAAAEEAVGMELQAELGDYVELIEVGKGATSEGLMQDLKVEDVLDAKIDRALKRLLHLKGIKSLTNTKPLNQEAQNLDLLRLNRFRNVPPFHAKQDDSGQMQALVRSQMPVGLHRLARGTLPGYTGQRSVVRNLCILISCDLFGLKRGFTRLNNT